MKRTITLLTIFLGLYFGISAQSFIVYDENNNPISNRAELSVTTSTSQISRYNIRIKNNSGTEVTARISKNESSVIEGSTNTMCSPTTNAGGGTCSMGAQTQPFILAAGETSNVAELDFDQGLNAGTSVITYKVFNVNNDTDFISFTITFSTEVSATSNLATAFNIYPNPASTGFTLQYDFNPTSYIEIYNVLGKVVARINPRSGSSINIDCSKWEKGYYFCRLYNNSKVEKTVKLVVAN